MGACCFVVLVVDDVREPSALGSIWAPNRRLGAPPMLLACVLALAFSACVCPVFSEFCASEKI